ncbi:MAG TPA: sulfatase [Phycisphaerae bacterium]|nr:sulfatase [Phycisphaerae bacterium]
MPRAHMLRSVLMALLGTLPAIAAENQSPMPSAASAVSQSRPAAGSPSRLNVLLITADDMNYDSPGVAGCRVPSITPHIDRLASQGMRFVHAHVTSAVCQPSRSVLMTGRYPHRNGAMGFEPIREDVPTLQESLRSAGYMNGIFGKVNHLAPQGKFCWDAIVATDDLGHGRDPGLYYKHAKSFFQTARDAGRPFFLMANSHDPHRPFAGSRQEKQQIARGKKDDGPWPGAGRYYKTNEVTIPGFLPELPDVRKEVAEYFTSVHRCDETVGEILRALREVGQEDNTLVMFLSDNGMAFPFAKTNCYLASTRTPWIVRWPGGTKPGTVDSEHMISGIDYMPTVLEAAGLPMEDGMDGRSFAPLLRGERRPDRDWVCTVFNQTSGRQNFPMRCVQTKRFGYIFNAWSDGKTTFRNESQSGLTFDAMKKAAESDPQIEGRVKHFLYRVPEEFYDFERDPCALHNLIDDASHAKTVAGFRKRLRETMKSTSDPLLPQFEARLKQDKAG